MKHILEGLKVLDLTSFLPGPWCTQIMADYGADVTKIEIPGSGDAMREMGGEADYFSLLNRGKKSVALNLKDARGKEIFIEFVKQADILVEGFRPGVMEKIGLDYTKLVKTKPDLIYCAITGYGQSGPYQSRAGHDLNFLALSGILDTIGSKDGPPVIPGVQIADIGGGGLFALFGIMAAIYYRERTGQGQYIDVSMLDGLLSWLPLITAECLSGSKIKRGQTMLTGKLACYNIYKTKDSKYMSLAALEPKFWQEFCAVVERGDLLDKQYQPDQESLRNILKGVFIQKTRGEWEQVFALKDACCEPVLEIEEVINFSDSKKEINQLGYPIKCSAVFPRKTASPPALGAHTKEMLLKLGFNEKQIEMFKNNGVI
ncbi:CoA transferase [Thermodesulfovibrionales bacterium]|nr:CoA transferase [Thermodesulfovibrionales bacterium]MCL0075082.1 CoA transferase [Thermodesulfovibrionales bacterium]